MGEKVEGAKKDDGAVTAVFKIDMHCEGCATKVERAVKHLEGVSKAKADCASNKLTVTGRKFDAAAIKSKLEQKLKKKIEIVSPQPKKDGDKKSDEKSEKKTDEKAQKKSEEKKAKESTVVLKMRLHCQGCIQRIWKSLIKLKGVNEINMDAEKDLITVKGTIEGKDIASFLSGKFQRSVEVVPPKKEEPAAAKPAAAKPAGTAKVEVNKMDYGGYYGGYYGGEAHPQYGYPTNGFANLSGYYTNQNYSHAPQMYGNYSHAPQMYGNYSHAPQMFSDENTNACSVM